jgi:hypothetical protein
MWLRWWWWLIIAGGVLVDAQTLLPYPAISTISTIPEDTNATLTIGVTDNATVPGPGPLTLVVTAITGGGRFFFVNDSTWRDASTPMFVTFTTSQYIIFEPSPHETGVDPPYAMLFFYGTEGNRSTANATWTIQVTPVADESQFITPDSSNETFAATANVSLPMQIIDNDQLESGTKHAYQIRVIYLAEGEATMTPCFFINTTPAVDPTAFPDTVFHSGSHWNCVSDIFFTGPYADMNAALALFVLDTNGVSGTVNVTYWEYTSPPVYRQIEILSNTFAPTPSPTMTPTLSPTPAPTPFPTPAPERQIMGWTVAGFTVLCVLGGLIIFLACGLCCVMRANEGRMIVKIGNSGQAYRT